MEKKYNIKTLREQVNTFIKSKIVNGELKPGEKINEFELAEEIGISRGPVREALRQIEQEGLVSYVPNKGCTVKKLNEKEIYEMSLIRANLEILAVDVCEGIFRQETIAKMEDCIVNMKLYEEKKNLGKIIAEDQKFHELIVKESGFPILLKLWHMLDGTNISVYTTMESINELCWGKISSNHNRILDIIKTGNIETIQDILKNHYEGATTVCFKR